MPWRSAALSREGWDAEVGDGLALPLLGPVSVGPESVVVEDGADFGLFAPVVREPAVVEAMPDRVCAWRCVERDGRVLWACVDLSREGARVRVLDAGPDVPDPERAVLVADADGEDAAFPVATVWRGADRTWIVPGWVPTEPALVKSGSDPIPPGARWITVHPHGEGTKGQPVLVMPVKGEKGAYRVIGGAGGRLHMLKLRGVKDPGEYAAEAKARAAKRREERKAAVAAEKAAGVHEAKQAAREDVRRQRFEAERAFVLKVAQALGWSLPAGYADGDHDHEQRAGKQGEPGAAVDAVDAVDADGAKPSTPQGAGAGKKGVHARLLAAARRAVLKQRDMLVADAERLAQAELGEPGADDALTAADLDPVRPKGDAVNHAWGARAKAAGLTDEVKAAKVAEAKGQDPGAKPAPKGGDQAAADEADPLAGLDLGAGAALSPKDAAGLLRELKRVHAVQRQAREALGAIDRDVEPKAYVIRADDEQVDDAVLAGIEEQVRARVGASFLGAVDAAGGETSLEAHVGAGAHALLDEVGQLVGGRALLDRSVVDALGVAGAARAMAWRLHHDLGGEQVRELAEALERRQSAETHKRLAAAVERAKALQQEADEADVGHISGADEIAAAFAVHRRRQEALHEARRALGVALGEAEAGAALALALREKPADVLQLSLGAVGADQAAVRLAALGLRPDDYRLEKAGDGVIAHIGASGLARLSAALDPDEVARLRRNRDIIDGKEDEDGWLPAGFARRPDLDQHIQPGVAPSLAEPMDWAAEDRVQALRDYMGLRFADGHSPASILGDLQSSTFLQQSGDAKAYLAALDKVLPLRDEKGKLRRVEDLAPLMQQYADAAVQARYGAGVSSLNRQRVPDDEVTREAMFRALAQVPEGKVAYKAIGELTDADRRVLRDYFARHVARESPEQAALREKVEKLKAAEPERYVEDMFGEQSESPAWQAWRQELDQAVAAWNAAGLSWPRYVQVMGGRKRAWRAVQDLIRSRVSQAFADQYNRLRPGAALKVGRTVITDNIRHLDAVDPVAREKRLAEHRALVDALRARVKGKYAAGAVSDKLDALMASKAAFQQAQMSFFAADEVAPQDEPLRPDERVTLGHAVEQQLAALTRDVGRQVSPGSPVKLFNPAFSGEAGAKRQRMIRLLEANKRLIAAAGVGSGKTAIGLGGFTHLHAAGKVKKGLFVVPSVVQGQFDAEALRFLEPDRYRWHAKPGASFEERLAAYKDPGTHFVVVTHQAFRDDVLRMAALRDGVSVSEVASKIDGMSREQRAEYVAGVLAHHGVSLDYVMADEAHGLLDRDGKEDSRLSQVVAAVTDRAPYYVHASADPVKNDLSEVHSLLSKVDPARYADKAAFMRRFGALKASGEALRRELLRYGYAMALVPDVPVSRAEVKVALSDAQREALAEVDRAAAALRLARMQGKVDVEAARKLAPAAFEGVAQADHHKVAADLARSVGMVRAAAVRRVIDEHPGSAKLARLEAIAQERAGKQGVVFARSLASVEAIRQRLQAKGLRVGTITGKHSAEQKAEVIRGFNPGQGAPKYDVVVASDAGAVGANLQSGRWLVQYDTPDTAMVHAQRQGRIHRIGQKGPVELIDLVADHESEARARRRLADKYGLRELLTSPMEGMDDTGLAWWLHQKDVQGGLF